MELSKATHELQEARRAPYRLTLEGRQRLCERIQSGWTITAAAESTNLSRQCASKGWNRFLADGIAGLEDQSSRPN